MTVMDLPMLPVLARGWPGTRGPVRGAADGNRVDNGGPVSILESMAKKRPLTRAERRAARPEVPDARVYGVEIRDAGATSWNSRIIFFASTPGEATEIMRAADLYKRVILGHLRHDEIPADGAALARQNPGALFLSQFDDEGWTAWMRLPSDYKHPSRGLAPNRPQVPESEE